MQKELNIFPLWQFVLHYDGGNDDDHDELEYEENGDYNDIDDEDDDYDDNSDDDDNEIEPPLPRSVQQVLL